MLGWGEIGFLDGASAHVPTMLDGLSELYGVQCIAISDNTLLALTKQGKVYSMSLSAESQVITLCEICREAVVGH